ncbi:Rhomboid protease GlpG [Candidatus Bilamarchaeum dharawalense]|uniref:Rhomboid protease GlpG n=1 Tax=Candidatus Bilamarchaeum dharawalense TaxID=2885759 RepID=A0A5E4LNQ5_9ARCH|nr:Rhomboid protease GlpG [Candidatus Bilamarchaeum dharawalense]
MNVSTTLLAFMLLIFVLQIISPSITNLFVFVPDYALSEPWRFVTSMFLHDGFMHIFFNGFALLMFGSILERRVSSKEYLIIFFGAGLLGSFLYYLTMFTPLAPLCSSPSGGVWGCPALGASGAIYGILGAVAVLLPEAVVYIYFFPVKMKYAPFLWFFLELLGIFNSGSGIANAAHLGGLIFGLICGWYLSKKQQDFYQPTWQQQ